MIKSSVKNTDAAMPWYTLLLKGYYTLKGAIGLIVMFFCILWFLNHCTPMMLDDYLYASGVSKTDFSVGISHASMMDVFTSCYYHYFFNNGRMANNLVFLMFYLGGKDMYNIVAALIQTTALFVLCRMLFGKATLLSLCLLILSCFVLYSGAYHAFFWCCGAFNYVWSACILIFSVFAILQSLKYAGWQSRILSVLGYFLLFFAASMHEMLGATLAGAMVMWLLYRRICRLNCPGQVWCALIVVLVGTALPMLSPGIHARAGSMDYFSLKFLLMSTGSLIRHTLITTIVFFALLIYNTSRKRFDLVYFYALVSFVLAYLMGMHSHIGNAYFYYSFAVTVWLLQTIAPSIRNWRPVYRGIIYIACLSSIAGMCYLSYRIDATVASAFELGKQQPVAVLDVNPINETEALAYVHALPVNPTHIYSYFVKYHKCRGFYVIQRKFKGDEKIYNKLLSAPPNEAKSLVSPNGVVCIRLPKGKLCCVFKGCHLYGSLSCRATICPYMEKLHKGIFVSMYDKYIAKQPFIYGGLDYYEGYVYVLLPSTQGQYSSCSLLLQDMQTGEEQELTVPLESEISG